MAQGKFTKSPTPSNIVSAVNAMVDDIAGKAASSHNHSASNITSGTLAVARGGTGVTANPSMLTNLGSTSAVSVFATSPRPGVTGTLPIANGGTGATTAKQARANLEVEPIGTIYAFAGNDIPAGYLPCNGGAISRTTYADLFAVIGTTYGTGDGSTTFNLPNLNNNSFLEGSDTAGNVKSAGLPNVKGRTYNIYAQSDGFEGALRNELDNSLVNIQAFDSGSFHQRWISFDASRYSSIYRDDITTVQPKSVTVKFCIKY